ncbi:unnamed protein product [Urochloa humidicola]
MCSVAARPSALGFDAAVFLDRRRGVAAVAPTAAGALASSAVCTQKRARDSSIDVKAEIREGFAAGKAPAVVPTPPEQQRLQERMRAELDAVRALHRKAVLLCRDGAGTSSGADAVPTAKGNARLSGPSPRREAPLEAAVKRRKANSSEESATEAAAHQMKMEHVKQLGPVKRAAPPPSAKEDAEMRRRMEETAREREEWRRLVLTMEMAALPDETVYWHELEELGIAPFEYAVTRTRSEALCGGGAR